MLRILLLIACLSFSGCGLMEKALMNAFAPNPEITRQKQETARYERATEAIDTANTPEKVKAQERVFVVASKQSHPGLYASVISGLYTEEGRRLAGVAMVALGSMIALGLRVASTWGLPGMLASTVKGIQDFKEELPKDDPIRARLNAKLSARHSGKGNMRNMVKKILGEG